MNSLLKFSLLVIVSVCLIEITTADKKSLNLQYKSNVTIDCNGLDGDSVQFFQRNDQNDTQITAGGKFSIEGKVLVIQDLRNENIRVSYYCKNEKDTLEFTNQIAPYIYKPEKQSLTTTAGGEIEFKCTLLYGVESNIKWAWKKDDTELKDNERVKILSDKNNETSLILSQVSEEDKGSYKCEAINDFGVHAEDIRLRVKDKYAALWPFLAICGEVVVLCAIILIYEKKCAKKSTSTSEDNEQTQNLMGNKDGHASDVKKRTAKA